MRAWPGPPPGPRHSQLSSCYPIDRGSQKIKTKGNLQSKQSITAVKIQIIQIMSENTKNPKKVNTEIQVTVGNDRKVTMKDGWKMSHFRDANNLGEISNNSLVEFYKSARQQLVAYVHNHSEVEKVGARKQTIVEDNEGNYRVNDTMSVIFNLGETDDHAKAQKLLSDKATTMETKASGLAKAARHYKAISEAASKE